MSVSLIVALAENGVIGKQGTVLPWRLPADLRHFKAVTMGHPIIMGRKTYETIGRPLPGRRNIIVTRNPDYRAEGCETAGSLPAALRAAGAAGEVFVIGGGELFQQALPLADKLYLTLVHAAPDGDVFFRYNPADWQELTREPHPADAKNQYAYSFLTLRRPAPALP